MSTPSDASGSTRTPAARLWMLGANLVMLASTAAWLLLGAAWKNLPLAMLVTLSPGAALFALMVTRARTLEREAVERDED